MERYSITQSKIIASNIKRHVKECEMITSEIYKELFVSKSEYYRLISGEVPIRVDFVLKVSRIINVDVTELLDGVDILIEDVLDEDAIVRENYFKALKLIQTYLSMQPKDKLKDELMDLNNHIIDIAINSD